MELLAVSCVVILALGLLALGIALGAAPPTVQSIGVAGYAALALSFVGRILSASRDQRVTAEESPLAHELTPALFGDFTPYVVEAAAELGEARDVTAVPALLRALEEAAEGQSPGWRDRGEAMASALGQIGDRRALPLLYRLENVRGIGFISAVRAAIEKIEPKTSLLRPIVESHTPHDLLRPASDAQDEADASELLRVDQSEAS
jgi:hypothetical protein